MRLGIYAVEAVRPPETRAPGALRVAGLLEVVGQQRRLFADLTGKNLLHGFANLAVILAAALEQDRVVGRFLREYVAENILQLRFARELKNHSDLLQPELDNLRSELRTLAREKSVVTEKFSAGMALTRAAGIWLI